MIGRTADGVVDKDATQEQTRRAVTRTGLAAVNCTQQKPKTRSSPTAFGVWKACLVLLQSFYMQFSVGRPCRAGLVVPPSAATSDQA